MSVPTTACSTAHAGYRSHVLPIKIIAGQCLQVVDQKLKTKQGYTDQSNGHRDIIFQMIQIGGNANQAIAASIPNRWPLPAFSCFCRRFTPLYIMGRKETARQSANGGKQIRHPGKSPYLLHIEMILLFFKKVGSQVTNNHQTGSIKNRELMMPQVFLNCNNCFQLYTACWRHGIAFIAVVNAAPLRICCCSSFGDPGMFIGCLLVDQQPRE